MNLVANTVAPGERQPIPGGARALNRRAEAAVERLRSDIARSGVAACVPLPALIRARTATGADPRAYRYRR